MPNSTKYLLLIIILIYSVSLFSSEEEGIWVEAVGEIAYLNITPEEAKFRALEEARKNAIAQVVGIDFQSETAQAVTEQQNIVSDFFSTVSQSRIYGRIVEEEIIRWEDASYQPHPNKPPIPIRRVFLRTKVIKEKGIADPSFQVFVKLNDKIFHENDSLEILISSTKESFITVFNLTADRKIRVLFPNCYQSDNRTGSNEVLKIPHNLSNDQAAYRLKVAPLQGHKEDLEWIKVIATRKKIKFSDFYNFLDKCNEDESFSFFLKFEDLQKILLSIPLSERTEAGISYKVFNEKK